MTAKSKGDEMSFWDHVEELRWTIFRSVLVVAAFSVAGFIFKSYLFDRIILPPAGKDFFVYRLLGWDFSMKLINVEISAQFFVHLKAALGLGTVLAFPFILWEIWRFVAPALYESEKKAFRAAFGFSSALFYLGLAVGYCIVLPVCLRFFLNYTVSDVVENSITLSSYMSMFLSLVLLIGVSFEFPVVVVLLNRMGILSRSTLSKGRRYAIVAVMVLSAIITPSDPFSMFALALPLYMLYELSILCSKDMKTEEE